MDGERLSALSPQYTIFKREIIVSVARKKKNKNQIGDKISNKSKIIRDF